MTQFQEYLFGIPLSTHRNRDVELGQFPYELLISAIAIAFFRTTLYQSSEPMALRWFFAAMLAFLTYSNQSYGLICSVELFSYAVSLFVFSEQINKWLWKDNADSTLLRLGSVAMSAVLSFAVCHLAASADCWKALYAMTPQWICDGLAAIFPSREVMAAYDVLDRFILEPGLLNYQIARLLFVTFHIQIGIGYLGIAFLKEEQQRRNELVRMDLAGHEKTTTTTTTTHDNDNITTTNDNDNDDKSKTSKNGVPPTITKKKSDKDDDTAATLVEERKMAQSRKFQRSALPFILYVAVPYMIKIIAFGNLNAFSYACFKNDVHRAVRLYDLFAHDNHLVAVAEYSAKSPEAFAGYMDTIVSTTYDLFNRKLFSLPKVMLLPIVMARQPKMMAQIFPVIFFADWTKGRAVAYMTSRIEQLQREIQELQATRSKVEAFDIKNAELLQRAGAGAIEFTGRRWEELTVQVQMKNVAKDLTARTKGFFAWIERNFVFSVLVDCALAHLIAVGKIVSADIFVFSRAIEDAVDMALMRSRSEAELARMMTQIDNMKELADVWDNAKERNLLPCNLAPPAVTEHAAESHASMVVVRNLLYTRGTAMVRVDHLELQAGIYALTGPNGSGKSTLFRLLMSCNSNDRSVDLSPSIVLSTPNEPIIEADDIEREKKCEYADAANPNLVAADDDVVAEARQLEGAPDKVEPHPRLSITMPSSHVVEISQTFYWPLYTRPIDWIFQDHVIESCDTKELDRRLRRVAEELHALEFTQGVATAAIGSLESSSDEGVTSAPSENAITGIMDQLLEEKEDWFGDLSGGQRSKVELVRKVFLQDECPHVLLVDETMAPLDPKSKSLVMSKLKAFCSNSVVIVIYHTDVGQEQQDASGESVECVPSNDFFDGNIHVEHQMIQLRQVC